MKAIFIAVLVCCGLSALSTAEAASLASEKSSRLRSTQEVSEESKALWDRFGGWCAIAEWHPAVKSCTESKEGDDTFRTLTLAMAERSRRSWSARVTSPIATRSLRVHCRSRIMRHSFQ